ncbi:MAG: ATP-grasp domain-containing protein [Bacteroidales bacterium]|nr:ATP-grasp domain-containing protein [Bacteroidales bacterium]
MNKRILIFGAGENQLTLIRKAKEMGLITVVIDPAPDPPGRKLADIFEKVDANDLEKTIGMSKIHRVEGIITSQMENPLRLMARVAEKLGFRFPSVEHIEQCRNKFLMKQAFLRSGVPCAKGVLIRPGMALDHDEISDLGWPLIIKPLDAFSSRGVFRMETTEDIERHLDTARSYSSNGQVLIEEFIEGPEFSVESITYEGQTHIFQITDKVITMYPSTVELAHIQPAAIDFISRSAIENTVIKAIKALGIDFTASHTELKLSPRGPVIIEVGARLGGDFISSYLTETSTGTSLEKAAIRAALGIPPEVQPRHEQGAVIRYLLLEEDMIVQHVGNWKQLLEEPDMIYANVYLKPGDRIPPVTDSAKRPGFVIVKGNTRDEALANSIIRLEELKSFIHLKSV